jgi:hypothetical protein
MKFFLLIRDIVYLLLIGVWMLAFFFNRQMANETLPLLLVVLFMNLDSRIGEIVKKMKELTNGKD